MKKQPNKLNYSGPVPTLIARLIVGLIFISEGIQKFILPEIVGAGRFAKIGFSNPEFWALFTGSFEIICGVLVFIGLYTCFAAIPLLIIMATAFITTKLPVLLDKGFWTFAHEYRTDFAMTMLLVFLLYFGGGNLSADKRLNERGKK
jgi:putative oxidoreductase